jgi:hypothetical protein
MCTSEKYTDQDLFKNRDLLIGLNNQYQIPVSGRCDTKNAEILCAVTRVIYRYFNDGDSMYVGYGCETCGSEGTYLMHEVPELMYSIKNGGDLKLTANDPRYTHLLNEIAIITLKVLKEQPDQPLEKGRDDYTAAWNNQLCNSCECYYPEEELFSDGMGNSYCSLCGEDED